MDLLLLGGIEAVIMPTSAAISIILFGLAYASLVVVLQRKLSDPVKIREMQTTISNLSAEINSLTKTNQDSTAKQKELMGLMGQSMKLQMKSMFVVLPLFFIIYDVVLPAIYYKYVNTIFIFIVPFTYKTLFFATVFILGLVISLTLISMDKKRAKRASQKYEASVQVKE